MNDSDLSRLMKNTSAVSEITRDQHIAAALQNFNASLGVDAPRKPSRTTIWSIAAAALFFVGAGVGVALQNLTDDDLVMYADADIEALGAMTTSQESTIDGSPANTTKGSPPAIGPCDAQYSAAKFVTVVRINEERVAIYAMPASNEPVVLLVDPNTCGEFAIAQG